MKPTLSGEAVMPGQAGHDGLLKIFRPNANLATEPFPPDLVCR
jgi:hypothetical protein